MRSNTLSSNQQVSLGFTGVGKRGEDLIKASTDIDNLSIDAICDLQDRRLDAVVETLTEAGRPAPTTYADHETMLEAEDLDGVVIATSWRYHIPMAIEAMEAGVTAAMDVGPASSVQQCWDLVKAAERTGQRCMLLENSCFNRDRMAVLNMVRDGLFGELIHCQCGYLHDIRPEIHGERPTRMDERDGMGYRTLHYRHRNGDVYPTHGIGPMANYLDINRGNRFVSLTSTASKSRGLQDWADDNLADDAPTQNVDWALGDVVTTVLKCANGETVIVNHDCSLPRPKSDMRQVQGTDGLWHADSDAIHVEGRSPSHEWESFAEYREEFEHPLWESYQDRGIEGGHGGADFLVMSAFVESIAQDVRPPVDVYDAATWMAITPLSEQSIAEGNSAVAFPDFTNSEWLVDDPIFGLTGDVPADRLAFDTIL